jgi:hypothetical protein
MGSARIVAGIGVAVMLTAMGLPQDIGSQYQTFNIRRGLEGYSYFRESYPAPRVYIAPYVPQRASEYGQKVVHHKRYR